MVVGFAVRNLHADAAEVGVDSGIRAYSERRQCSVVGQSIRARYGFWRIQFPRDEQMHASRSHIANGDNAVENLTLETQTPFHLIRSLVEIVKQTVDRCQ